MHSSVKSFKDCTVSQPSCRSLILEGLWVCFLVCFVQQLLLAKREKTT